jgi:tight adherence protein B
MKAEFILNIIILITVFALVFSLWCFCVFVWLGKYLSRLKNIQQRLGLIKSETTDESKILRLWRDTLQDRDSGRVRTKTAVIHDKLKRVINDAGWRVPVKAILLGLGGTSFLVGIFAYVLTDNFLAAVAGVLVVVFGFMSYTQRRVNKRADLFENQLVDALGIAVRSLRAGHPLAGSFQVISEEIKAPLGNVFYRICQEQSLGLDMKDSIRTVAGETSNSELRLFATAVAIQLQSGGNLADLMDILQGVIRARIRLAKKVRVLTAQTNFTAKILIAMPIVLFFVLNIVSPRYMEPMYHTTAGKYILAATAISVLLGWWIMKRLSVLRF